MKRHEPEQPNRTDHPIIRKDLWPAKAEFTQAIADLQAAWKDNKTPTARRSRSERQAWQHLIALCGGQNPIYPQG